MCSYSPAAASRSPQAHRCLSGKSLSGTCPLPTSSRGSSGRSRRDRPNLRSGGGLGGDEDPHRSLAAALKPQEWLLPGLGRMPPSTPYLALREQCQGFEGDKRSLAAGALHPLALLLPLICTVKGIGHPSGPVTAAALLYPAVLRPPIASATLPRPGGQYPLGIKLRLALVL